jgi:hypothetical protein
MSGLRDMFNIKSSYWTEARREAVAVLDRKIFDTWVKTLDPGLCLDWDDRTIMTARTERLAIMRKDKASIEKGGLAGTARAACTLVLNDPMLFYDLAR